MSMFVSGLVNVETPVKVAEFPIAYYPIDYPFFGIQSAVSGVGYNVAKALVTLGDAVTLAAFVGDDLLGTVIEQVLAADGIAASHVSRVLAQTPQSVVLYDPSGRRQIYCDLKDIQERSLDCAAYADDIAAASAVVACNLNCNRPLLHEAKKQGTLVATDVHVLGRVDDEYNREFLQNADVVFLSDEQLPCPPAEFLAALKSAYRMDIIVLGQGANGATLYDRATDTITHFDSVRNTNVVNTVGAGDALFSCFLHFFAKGMDARDALLRAQTFASAKVSHNGAAQGFLTESQTESLVAQNGAQA